MEALVVVNEMMIGLRRILRCLIRPRRRGPPVVVYDPAIGRDFVVRFSGGRMFRASTDGLIVFESTFRWITASEKNLTHLLDLIVEHHKPVKVYIGIHPTCTDLPMELPVPEGGTTMAASVDRHAYMVPVGCLSGAEALVSAVAVRARFVFTLLREHTVELTVDEASLNLDYELLASPAKDDRVVVIWDTDDDFLMAFFPREEATKKVTDTLIAEGIARLEARKG